MPNPKITLDTSEWREAVDYVFRNTRKTLPDIINRSALVTLIGGKGVVGAIRRTPKADKNRIMAVPIKFIAAAVIARARKKGVRLNAEQRNEAIGKEYRRRAAASGYTAYVGWDKAIRAFGGRGIGRARHQGGWATEGYGIKSTPGKFEAIMVNTAPAAELIGLAALQGALNDAAIDMVEHTNEKLNEIFRPASAKK